MWADSAVGWQRSVLQGHVPNCFFPKLPSEASGVLRLLPEGRATTEDLVPWLTVDFAGVRPSLSCNRLLLNFLLPFAEHVLKILETDGFA